MWHQVLLNSKVTIDKHIGHMQEAIWLGVIATIAIFIVIGNLVINSIGGGITQGLISRGIVPKRKEDPGKTRKKFKTFRLRIAIFQVRFMIIITKKLADKIQGYVLHGELCKDGMATVYLAYENKFDTSVAIIVRMRTR